MPCVNVTVSTYSEKIPFGREIWNLIDVVVAVFLLWLFFKKEGDKYLIEKKRKLTYSLAELNDVVLERI